MIKSNHHFQTERYLFFIFNPRTSRHWIINYSFQSRQERQTGAGETGGLEINISIIFTLYISTRLQRTYCFIQVGCHVTIHVPFHLNCSIRERRHSTQFGLRLKSELWHVGGWRVRHPAQPSPAQPGPSEADLLSRNSCLISPFFTRVIIGCQIFLFAPLPFCPRGPWLQCGHMTNIETVHSYHSIPVLPLAVK